MTIRPAAPADLPAIAELNRGLQAEHAEAYPDVFRKHTDEQEILDAFRKALEEPTSYWLVAEEEHVIGFLSAEFQKREASWYSHGYELCYIGAIAVAPQFQRRGVARALLEELKREAAVRGTPEIQLDVFAFNNASREAFAKLGFQSMKQRMRINTTQED